MELSKYAQAVKNELALTLQKQGSSLAELEEALQNINTGDGVLKVAKELGDSFKDKMLNRSFDIATGSIPEMAFKGSLAGGALAGLGLDEMDKSVDSLNKALDSEREKVHLVRRITQNLKREHGLI
jgi:hypothetical protein